MTFADIPAGASVFLDANTLTYYFQPHPKFGPACDQLMRSIEQQQILGFTATHMLSEMAHRLMTIEASTLFSWPFANIGNRLRTHPAEVQRLTKFRAAIDSILQSKVQVLTVTPDMVASGALFSQQLGLLTNDGMLVAVMRAHGLTLLASHDADFDRVPGLTRYAPA